MSRNDNPALPSPPPQPDAGKVSFSPFNRIAFERWLYRALDENWAGGMPERWQCQQACAVIAAEIDSVLCRAPAPPGPAATAGDAPCHICGYHPGSAACSAGHNAPPGAVKAEAVESALHAALAERDANAQTAKAMSKLHDEAEMEIGELHATIARLAAKAEVVQGVTEAMVCAAVGDYARAMSNYRPAIANDEARAFCMRAALEAALKVRP